MKFICNNCGFSAEIPEKRSNCPMCASSNVTVVEERVGDEKKKEAAEPGKSNSPEEAISVPDANSGTKEEDVRKEKITLTDNFFDQKPNKEEQEIADVLKELYPDEEKRENRFKLPDWRILAGIGASVVIFLVVVVVSMTSDNSEKAEMSDIEDVEDIEEKVEEIKEEPVEQVEEKEDTVAEVEEKESEPEEEEEKKAEIENKPQKKIAEVEKKKKPAIKKRKPVPKKKIAKKKARPKNVDVNKKYNDFLQLGHTALGQKRYTDALHEYKNAMRLKPRSGKVYKFIGIAYAYLQNQNQACKNYRKYIQLTPNAKDKAQVQAFLEACP